MTLGVRHPWRRPSLLAAGNHDGARVAVAEALRAEGITVLRNQHVVLDGGRLVLLGTPPRCAPSACCTPSLSARQH